jgi:hypothetical protein
VFPHESIGVVLIVVRAQRPDMLRAVPKPVGHRVKNRILGDMLHDKPLEPHSHQRSNLNNVRACGKALPLQNRIYRVEALNFVAKVVQNPREDGRVVKVTSAVFVRLQFIADRC